MENCEFKNLKDLQKKLKDQSIKKKLCKIYYIILIIDFEEQKKFNEDFEKKYSREKLKESKELISAKKELKLYTEKKE